MVDWKEIGKKTFDVTKDVTEKGVDSLRNWKEDPVRIAKAEKKKTERKIKKVEKINNKESNMTNSIINEDKKKVCSYTIKNLGVTTITLLDKAILIERNGSLQTFKGKNIIPLSKITSVHLQPASSINNGYIHFTIPGGKQPRNGILNAASDINSVIFKKKNNSDMFELRDLVEDALLNLYEGD